MELKDFDYKYPKELVAQHPLSERDASRMMVIDRKARSFQHSKISNLPDVLREGDLIVFNDSKVAPARLFGARGNGEPVEILVVEEAPREDCWLCLLKKAKRIRAGEKFFFGLHATASAMGRQGIFLVLEFKGRSLPLAMKYHGVPPLPPYIERKGFDSYSSDDRERYQTVFAKRSGSAAAPTAGLHFSEGLLKKIAGMGIESAFVTLHVGIDTFAPVRANNILDHKMHGEMAEVSPEAAEAISRAKAHGRRVIACGTTVARVLESFSEDGKITAGRRTTNLFITPGYAFKIADALITNFHLPKSTLLMLVSAFAGREFILKCYEEAMRERYRLFSYGDCMIIF